jgi:uncharacterized protein YbjQ (UPF0145 family)
MKILLGIALVLVFSSCAMISAPKIDFSYPNVGTYNDAEIVVKNFQTVGIITVKSSEIIESNGNHTGSKITNEMLMLEARRLNADDVINVRIDINQVEETVGFNVIKTINYTATALAIRYTTAVVVENDSQGNVNRDTLGGVPSPGVQVLRRPTGGVKNNWLSAEINLLGVGARYERMLNSGMSIGANIYYQAENFMLSNELGIDLTARFYLGRIFYIGAGLGFHSFSTMREYWHEWDDGWDIQGEWRDEWEFYTGFAITPDIGVKINLGNSGLYMEPGVKIPIILSEILALGIIPYVGIGWSF